MAMLVITRWFICGFWSDLEKSMCFFFGRSPWRQCSVSLLPPKVAAQGCSVQMVWTAGDGLVAFWWDLGMDQYLLIPFLGE